MAGFGGLQSSPDESEEDCAEEVIRKGEDFGLVECARGVL